MEQLYGEVLALQVAVAQLYDHNTGVDFRWKL